MDTSTLQYNDPNFLPDHSYEWRRETIDGYSPSSRYGHSSHIIGNYYYLIGGISNEYRLKDIDRYNLITKTWEKVIVEGETPISRFNHSSCAIGDMIYLFGGETDKKDIVDIKDSRSFLLKLLAFNDDKFYFINNLFSSFNTKTSTMQTYSSLTSPRPSIFSALVSYPTSNPQYLYLFGGVVDLHPVNQMVRVKIPSSTDKTVSYETIRVMGRGPSPRFGMIVQSINDVILIYGGTNYKTVFSDIWLFFPKNNIYKLVEIYGSLPPIPLYNSSSCVYSINMNYVYLFGGITKDIGNNAPIYLNNMYVLKLINNQYVSFSLLDTIGDKPSPRALLSLTTVPTSTIVSKEVNPFHVTIFLFGGRNQQYCPNDMYSLSLIMDLPKEGIINKVLINYEKDSIESAISNAKASIKELKLSKKRKEEELQRFIQKKNKLNVEQRKIESSLEDEIEKVKTELDQAQVRNDSQIVSLKNQIDAINQECKTIDQENMLLTKIISLQNEFYDILLNPNKPTTNDIENDDRSNILSKTSHDLIQKSQSFTQRKSSISHSNKSAPKRISSTLKPLNINNLHNKK